MSKLIVAMAALAIVLAACGGSPTNPPGATETPGTQATATPGETQGGEATPTTPPDTGDLKAKAQALLPSDAAQTAEFSTGGAYQVYATSKMSLSDLEAFWEQKLKDLGITQTGKFTADGTLTIAFTNPDGGIVAGTDASTGDTAIVISLGTSS